MAQVPGSKPIRAPSHLQTGQHSGDCEHIYIYNDGRKSSLSDLASLFLAGENGHRTGHSVRVWVLDAHKEPKPQPRLAYSYLD
jgi:hypothetical protein